LSALGVVLFPQVAFVAGGLAFLRALRRRGNGATDEELAVIRVRAAIALAAGALTALSMAVWIVEYRQPAWLLTAPLLAASLLTAALIAVAHAAEPRAPSGGAPDDVFDDLGFRMESWHFAMLCAVAVGVLGFAGGWIVEGDPGSGIVRGGFEGVAVLACYAVLGRPLALRR